jgi:hypothetical protein
VRREAALVLGTQSAEEAKMLRIRPSPAPRTEVRTKTRRPPLAYIELLSAGEEEFRQTVESVEDDPLFDELHALGVVKKRGGRGRMPQAAYEERLDAEVAEFVKRYGLDRRPGGLEQLGEVLQAQGAEAVAEALGASVGEVRRVARFLVPGPDGPAEAERAGRSESPRPPDLEDVVAGATPIDISRATATVRDFVHRFSLSEHQLVGDFLHGEDSPAQLARRYRTRSILC